MNGAVATLSLAAVLSGMNIPERRMSINIATIHIFHIMFVSV